MCKGIGWVLTEKEIYWSVDSNSYEGIKQKYNLKDNIIIRELLIVEAYPRGKSIFSTKYEDWEVIFENSPHWFDKTQQTDRVLNHLFNVVMTQWKMDKKIKATLDLSALNYKILPDDLGDWATEVYCSHNQLTSLSLPKATEVDCSSNPKKFTKEDWLNKI